MHCYSQKGSTGFYNIIADYNSHSVPVAQQRRNPRAMTVEMVFHTLGALELQRAFTMREVIVG